MNDPTRRGVRPCGRAPFRFRPPGLGAARAWAVLAAAWLAFGAREASGVIRVMYSLQQVMDASHVIAGGEIESVNVKDRTAVIRLRKTFKGENAFTRIRMNVAVGQEWYPEALMHRLKPGEPVLVFYDVEQGRELRLLGHTAGIWFQLFATVSPNPDDIWWRFTHVEIMFNRTFEGLTPDLTRIVGDALAGRAPPPPPNPEVQTLTKEAVMSDDPVPVVGRKNRRTAPGPSAAEDARDGLEKGDWTVEPWGAPAVVSANADAGDRGVVLRAVASGDGEKIAVRRAVELALPPGSRLLCEVFNRSDKDIGIAWAFSTGEAAEYQESPPQRVPPGRWVLDLAVSPQAAAFKSEATGWRHEAPLRAPEQIRSLTLLVYGAARDGEVWVDRIRADARPFFVRALPLGDGAAAAGTSVAMADYDGDGHPDVLVCAESGIRLFRGEAGEYRDATAESGLRGGSRCGSWADVNGDGRPDLLLSAPALWINEGGRFRDATALLPRLRAYNTEGAGWLDANGDGRPDILLTNGEHGVFLFLNEGGDGPRFRDASAEWGVGPDGFGRENGDFLCIADFDADGFSDWLYNVGRGLPVRNLDGARFERLPAAGLDFATGGDWKIGAAFADMDLDGDLDLFVPQRGKSKLYRNNNDLAFRDATAAAGDLADVPEGAISAAWGDVNGDGLPDLFVGFADRPARLYLNRGLGGFEDASEAAGMASFPTAGVRGAVFADADGDGDDDLLVTVPGRGAFLLVNAAAPPEDRWPLTVRLDPRMAPGALVRVFDARDRLRGFCQVGTVGNFSAQGPAQAVFRLAPGEYRATVLATDGRLREIAVTMKTEPAVWNIPWEAGETAGPAPAPAIRPGERN